MTRFFGYTRLLSTGAPVSLATVTVYNAGTLVLATIFDDDLATPTPKANPFTSDSAGFFYYYGSNTKYDIRFSAGTPAIPTPFTWGDVSLGAAAPLYLIEDGSAGRMIRGLGIEIGHDGAMDTTFNTLGGPAWVGFYAAIDDSGARKGATVYAGNFLAQVSSTADGACIGCEIDVNNNFNAGGIPLRGLHQKWGLSILSGGAFQPTVGIIIDGVSSAAAPNNAWHYGISIGAVTDSQLITHPNNLLGVVINPAIGWENNASSGVLVKTTGAHTDLIRAEGAISGYALLTPSLAIPGGGPATFVNRSGANQMNFATRDITAVKGQFHFYDNLVDLNVRAQIDTAGIGGSTYFLSNLGIGTTSQFGTGSGVLGLADASVVPTTNPAGGGVLYSQAGALKWRGAAGTITTVAPA